MCGIAGIITTNAQNYRHSLEEMTRSIAYRGPDSSNHVIFENAALGHRRLAIIDLSETGAQPMYSNTKNECIVLNGEIYGYLELKKNYQNYPFSGTSDTELVLAMYQEMGVKFIQNLPGMFAFALWNEQSQELFCARDRFGEKPFYYAWGKNGEFIFASEIKAILATGLVKPEIDQSQIAYYLTNGYIHPNHSIYKNIYNLPPAHTLTLKDGKLLIERYWKMPTRTLSISLPEAIENFKFLLDKAVKKQMIADVPVGSFLSGGLDSSTIVAVGSSYSQNMKTICYGYETGGLNEMPYARAIAEKYNTNHIEILDKKQSITDTLNEVYNYMDEPLMDSSLLPSHLIYKEASKSLKVVLSGDVGDELFGGYTFYKYNINLDQKGFYPYYLSKMLLGIKQLNKLLPLYDIGIERERRAKFTDIVDYHQNSVRNYFTKEDIKALGLQDEQPKHNFSFELNSQNYNTLMRIDLEKYVPGNMLLKADRTAMYNSVEGRIPFLDVDFAEFCIQLPSHFKVTSTEDKIILRKAYSQMWTEEIAKRGKNGFAASVTEWFNEPELMQLSEHLLNNHNSFIFNYLNFNEVQKKLNKNLQHWSLLVLALWFEKQKNILSS